MVITFISILCTSFFSLLMNNYLVVYICSFGHVFLVDTGTSNGTIGGPSKPINSCDFRPARPFRIIAGSEDNSVTVFEGIISTFLFLVNRHLK